MKRLGHLFCKAALTTFTLGLPATASAQPTYVVDNPSDQACNGAPGTLRWALKSANLDGQPSKVVLSPSMAPATIYLECPLDISDSLDFVGHEKITINGSALGAATTIEVAAPGGYFNASDLRLDGGARGLSLSTDAVWIHDCSFTRHKTTLSGAAIAMSSGDLDIDRCYFGHNEAAAGGALHLFHVALNLSDVQLDSNRAASGGAIFLDNSYAYMEGSTFDSNAADKGGAIAVATLSTPALDVVNATFSNNGSSAAISAGGAVYVLGVGLVPPIVSFLNATFYGNEASAGSALGADRAVVKVVNSILQRDPGATGLCWGINGSDFGGHHDIWNDSSCLFGGTGSYPNTSAMLGPLGDHGGDTSTHVPAPASKAIGTGASNLCPLTDQRGVTRSTCWMGSYEQ